MNTLPQDLIKSIRSYDRHPCGDMLSNCRSERFDNAIMQKPQNKGIHHIKFNTVSLFVIRDDATEEAAIRYESEVVERNIYNTFKIKCLTEDTLHQLRQESCYMCYLHFTYY